MILRSLLAGIVLLFVWNTQVSAEVNCGDTICTDDEICLDAGDGPQCMISCRSNDDCESGCCASLSDPLTAWVCMAQEICDQNVTEDDDDENITSEEKCGDLLCKPEEMCLEWGRQLICTPRCETNGDCDSYCCREDQSGRMGCIPESLACDDDSTVPPNTVDEGCRSTNTGLWVFFVLMSFGAILRNHMKRIDFDSRKD